MSGMPFSSKHISIPDDLGSTGQQIVQLGQQFIQSAQTEHDTQLKSLFALLPATMTMYLQPCMDHVATDLEYVGTVWVAVGDFLEYIAQKSQNAELALTAGLHDGEYAD